MKVEISGSGSPSALSSHHSLLSTQVSQHFLPVLTSLSSIVIQPEFEFVCPPGEPEHRQPVELAEQPRPSPDQPHHPSAGRPVQPPRGRDDGGGAVPHRGVQHPRPPTRPCSPPLPWACLSHQLAKPPARFFQHCRPSPPPKEI